MAEMDDIREKITTTLREMSLGQKLSIGITIIMLIIGFTLLMQWVTKPDYALLFSNVDLKEAGEIIDALNAEDVSYKTSAAGTAISIPAPLVYEWRIKLATSGVMSSGSIGYEIFDSNDIGISDFKQNVNLKRALEGELQRTIEGFSGVKSARVHIVMPKARLFKDDQNPTTASVVLELSGARLLTDSQVNSIVVFVSGSVEGLAPENVKIVDDKMRVLSNMHAADSFVGLSSSQHDMQKQVEAHLVRKANLMLNGALGENSAIVEISADLDFDRIQSTRETYDPETSAILAEQRNELSDSEAGQETGTQETSTTNYNVPRTIEHITSSVGNIRRLSIAVIIDDKRVTTVDGNGIETETFIPRTAAELQSFENLVKNAVGFDDNNRDDQFRIENVHFDVMDGLQNVIEINKYTSLDYWLSIGRKVLPVVLLVVFVLMIRSQLRRVKVKGVGTGQLGGAVAMAGAGGVESQRVPVEKTPIPKIEDEAIPPEAAESAKLLQQISSFVEEKPSQAVKLLRYWLLEE